MSNQTTLPPLPKFYANKLTKEPTPNCDLPDPFGSFSAIEAAWGQNKPFHLGHTSYVDIQKICSLMLAQLAPAVSPQL